ncbi:hypothetical protein Q5752_001510 [Cryptotrichosporon argae]
MAASLAALMVEKQGADNKVAQQAVRLDKRNQVLQLRIDNLHQDRVRDGAQNETLQKQVKALLDENAVLKASDVDRETRDIVDGASIAGLRARHDRLKKDHDALGAQYDALKAERDELLGTLHDERETHAARQKESEALQTACCVQLVGLLASRSGLVKLLDSAVAERNALRIEVGNNNIRRNMAAWLSEGSVAAKWTDGDEPGGEDNEADAGPGEPEESIVPAEREVTAGQAGVAAAVAEAEVVLIPDGTAAPAHQEANAVTAKILAPKDANIATSTLRSTPKSA